MNSQKCFKAFVMAGLFALSGTARCDQAVGGTIAQIMVVASGGGAPGNADMRVYLSGTPQLCSGATDGTWAWLNTTDVSYKSMLAVMLTAQASGKTVTLVSRATPVGGGTYCQIIYALINS